MKHDDHEELPRRTGDHISLPVLRTTQRKTKTSAVLASILFAGLLTTNTHAIDATIGTEAATCQFPSAVRVGYSCSGVYVGNGVVLTAAHCVDEALGSSVAFGEDTSHSHDAEVVVDVEDCVPYPGGYYDTVNGTTLYYGVDLAFCTVDMIVPDQHFPVPVVPPMPPTGCERNWLAEQVYEFDSAIVTAVAGGCAEYTSGYCYSAGIKRYLAFQLEGQISHHGSSTKLRLERWDMDDGMQQGDSGGPVFDVLPDGTWRLLGVIHGESTNVAYAEAIPPYLHWIEDESERDITPCHELVNGEWQPDYVACAGTLPLDPEKSIGSWLGSAHHSCSSPLGGGNSNLFGGCNWPFEAGDLTVQTDSAGNASQPSMVSVQAVTESLLSASPTSREDLDRFVAHELNVLTVYPFLEPPLVQFQPSQEPSAVPGDSKNIEGTVAVQPTPSAEMMTIR